MERIKRALELARSQREEDRSVPMALRPADGLRQTAAKELGEIRYTQTRVEAVDIDALAERRVVARQPRDPRATQINILRTKVLQMMEARGWRTIAVTSAAPGAGKSFLAANLVASIAMQVDYTALVVDADLHHPSIAGYFGIEARAGLGDYLSSDIPLSSIMINPGMERLVLLPGSHEISVGSSGLLATPRMSQLVEELKTRYPSRVVLFDLPPLLATDDALAFLPSVDCALLVVESNVNTEKEVREAVNLLKGTNLLGTVFNKAMQNPDGPYYGNAYS